mmetsp:Transcript_35248/g.105334  ORF Transcript_35248/g.105334 Transcript_35248/m.105334 type:complete len:253 (+) Transcript_35248:36-794(+)
MQAEKLTKLHKTLEDASSLRGSAGGLGFNATEAKAARKAEKAAKRARGGAENKREFQSTSAGAVAAGHWDPWARPVAFEMKAKNTVAGGLYSMFVKGETVGGTLKEAQRAAADEAAGMGAPGEKGAKKRKGDAAAAGASKQEKKSRKRDKKSEAAAEKAAAMKAAGAKAATDSTGGFDWQADILRRLEAAPGGKLDAKRLRKAAVSGAAAALGSSDKEDLRKAYRRGLKGLRHRVSVFDDPATGAEAVELKR